MPKFFFLIKHFLIIIIILGKLLLVENQFYMEMEQARRNLNVIIFKIIFTMIFGTNILM